MAKDNQKVSMVKVKDKSEVTVIDYTMEDIPQLVKDENFYDAIEVIKSEGIDIKYGIQNSTRKRADLNELRNIAYTLQRDARAAGHDTSVIRDVIKGLNAGSSY